MRVEAVRRLHRGVGLVVDRRLQPLEALEEDVALVKPQRDLGRRLVRPHLDGRARRLRGGVEPAAVVDLVGDELRERTEEQRRAAIHHALVDELQAPREDFHAGSLVDAAALRADDAVLKRVLHAHAVAAADLVEEDHHVVRREFLAVDGDTPPLRERERHLLDLVGRVLRPHAHGGLDDAHRRLHRLQVLRLVREAREVRVGRILLLRADERGDAALGEERDHLGAAGELLEEIRVAPRRVDAEGRIHHVDVALEAHLVVAAPRRAVDEHRAAGLLHRGQEVLDGDGAGDARRVPVAAVIHRLALDRLEADVGHVLRDIDDLRDDARGRHLLLDVVDVLLVRLADVRRERLDLDARVLENAANRLRVEPARHAHANRLSLEIFEFHVFLLEPFLEIIPLPPDGGN